MIEGITAQLAAIEEMRARENRRLEAQLAGALQEHPEMTRALRECGERRRHENNRAFDELRAKLEALYELVAGDVMRH
jgi:hypothetical protein